MLGVVLAGIGLACGPALAADYTIDAAHSFVLFKVKHMGASYAYGQLPGISGSKSTRRS